MDADLQALCDAKDGEMYKMQAEIERLRVAYEQERTDCINLTEKVIPNLRAEIERLRGLVYAYPPSEPYAPDGVTWQQEAEKTQRQSCQCGEDEACKYVQEIERLRGALEAVSTVEGSITESAAKKDAEIERLRGLLREVWNWAIGGPTGVSSDLFDRVKELDRYLHHR